MFCIDILHLCCIGFLYDACLRVTMTLSTGHNNRLFAPGTDMDLALLCLSHMQRGTYYVQICDKCNYLCSSNNYF
jgi:hypothetical protein